VWILRSALLRSTTLNTVDQLEHLISKVNWVDFEINSVLYLILLLSSCKPDEPVLTPVELDLPSSFLVIVEKVSTCLFTPPLGNFQYARELEVGRKEKRLAKKEETLNQREEVVTELQVKLSAFNEILEEQRVQQTAAVERLQKLQRELEGKARDAALAEEKLKAEGESLDRRETDLARRETYLIRREKDLAFKEEMIERREKLLAEHELKAEEKERTLKERVRRFQAAPGPQAVEATKKALEDLQAEHRAGVQRIDAWAGEASTTLVPLGMSPIPVSELPTSISDSLPVLDSTADRLRRLDQILGVRLEAEGGRLCRAVIEYILTCFRSHDLAISLKPVIAGPVANTEDAAR
jgi:hypothetical protein